MATSQPSKMQVESERSVQDMVEELVELEVEEEEDPFKGMNNAQITEIYHRMKPEDCRLFRQFKSFHTLYFELHGHDVPSHHLARGIVHEIIGGLPAADTDIIANTRAELLAAERLKDLCKQLGLAVPVELQYYKTPRSSRVSLRHHHHYASLHANRKKKQPKNRRSNHPLQRASPKQMLSQT